MGLGLLAARRPTGYGRIGVNGFEVTLLSFREYGPGLASLGVRISKVTKLTGIGALSEIAG